ncbi:MAG: hypothetical protein AB7O28_13415 [Vicinamibacterales bacterium]
MTSLNAALTSAADRILVPLAGLPAVAVVLGAALATALVVLGVMRYTSNQAALASVKRRIHASLLEMRLFNDDVRALVRAQGEVLAQNALYIGHSLVPLVVTAVPLAFAIAQLQAYYGYTGLRPNVETTITIELTSALPAGTLPRLVAPTLDPAGPPRYFPSLRQVVWRVEPRAPGVHDVAIQMDGAAPVTKSLYVSPGDATARRSPFRDTGGLVSQLLYPSEPPLDPAGPIAAIRLDYPERTLAVAGFEMHWLILYVAASFVFVLLLRKPLGVVI